MDNRRKDPRLRRLKTATAVFNNGNSSLDCTMRDLSPGGARLKFESTFGLPERFVLVIKADSSRHNCHVAWHTSNEVGVTFE